MCDVLNTHTVTVHGKIIHIQLCTVHAKIAYLFVTITEYKKVN